MRKIGVGAAICVWIVTAVVFLKNINGRENNILSAFKTTDYSYMSAKIVAYGKYDVIMDDNYRQGFLKDIAAGLGISSPYSINSRIEDNKKITECENTAIAAKMVSEAQSNTVAAISSELCASQYNLEIIKPHIQNSKNNYTLSEEFLFDKIRMVEQTMPADFYKDKNLYKDMTKKRKLMTDLVYRPLANTLTGSRDFNIDINDIEKYQVDNT